MRDAMSEMAPSGGTVRTPPASAARHQRPGGGPGSREPRAARGRGRRVAALFRPRTRPDRVRALAVAAVAVCVLTGVITAVVFGSIAGGLRQIGDRSDPEVLATTDLYYRLNDMDAQVANVLLVGAQHGLGVDRQQAQAIYDQDRTQADRDLQRASAIAGTLPSAQGPLRAVLNGLGRYEALVGEAVYLDAQGPGLAGRPPTPALLLYRQATDLLQDGILPAARGLTDASTLALDRSYQAKRSAALDGALWVVLAGVALLVILAGLQIYLATRFRRLLTPALAAAFLVAVVLVAGGGTGLLAQAGHLRVAKSEAFDSIIALSQAHATSDDANADESRYLVDPGRAAQYQQAFENQSQQLARIPVAGIFHYDAGLAKAIDAYRANHADVRFGGYLGAEFRNITFPGERAAAQKTLAAYQVYERDDRHIRALNRAGDLRAAIAFDTSYARGNSNYAFTQYDNALLAVIAINQHAFNAAITAGQHGVSGWTGLIPAAAVILIIALLLAAVLPRLAEYRE